MTSQRCPKCDLVTFSTAIQCKRCGYNFQANENLTLESNSQTVISNKSNEVSENPQVNAFTENLTHVYPHQDWHDNHHYQPKYFNTNQPVQKQGLAIASLVVSLVFCPLIGMIMGIFAYRKAKNNPREYGGKTMAIIAMVLGGVSFVYIPFVLAIAIPNLLAARMAANESSAIGTVRTISAAEITFIQGLGKDTCGDFSQLIREGLLDPQLAGGTKNGYKFMLTRTLDGCEIHAMPIDAKSSTSTGKRSFYASSSEDWAIRAANNNGEPIGQNAPLLDSSFKPSNREPMNYPQSSSSTSYPRR